MQINKIKLDDINKVLEFRNHPLNKLNSISKKTIKKIDHYIWWFTQKKKKYLSLREKNTVLFFFFYEIIIIKNNKYLISGWYKNPEFNNFLKILSGLIYQYRFLQKIKKINKLDCEVALIYKKNFSMIKFARHLKWKKISKRDNIYKSLENFFGVKGTDFNFYVR